MNRFLHRFAPTSNILSSKTRLCAAFLGGTSIPHHPRRLYSSSMDANSATQLSVKGTSEFDNIVYNEEENKFLFMTSLSAPLVDTQKRSAIDLVCVLDESGSMTGTPIDLVKASAKFIVSNLTSNDRFGCVGFDSHIREIVDFKHMDSASKQNALQQIGNMQAGSATALCEGLEAGVEMMRQCKQEDSDSKQRVKNVLLLTDGQANVGYTDPKDIIRCLTDKEFADQGRTQKVEKRGNSKLSKFMKSATKWVELTPQNAKPETEQALSTEIPCSIDTFGFGEHHDANFLTMLSEYGRGLYTYVSCTEDIAGSFGEMLGGLLSVIAKDVKIRIKTLNDDVRILKCLAVEDNSTLKLTEIEKDKQYEIQLLNDVQSEETKDFLFELYVPKIDGVNNDWSYLHIECEYFNVMTNQTEQISTVCSVQRLLDYQQTAKTRNYQIDIQHNRIVSTTAVKAAIEMADKGELDKAKTIIKEAQNVIRSSVSKDDEFCVALVRDLDSCLEGMETRDTYYRVGSKKALSWRHTNVQQKAYQTDSEYADMASYASYGSVTKKLFRKLALDDVDSENTKTN